MKKLSINLTLVLSLLLFGFTASKAQLADEIRPFDFNNDYYKANGLVAEMLVDRRNGADRKSVFDSPTDLTRFNDVRILETLPAYAPDGSGIFWNRYAIAPKDSFRADEVGDNAARIAVRYPIYRFPSTTVPGSDRQSALIGIDSAYFGLNPIGISQVLTVMFRDRVTPGERRTLDMLAERNGRSVDGTPIIRTMSEFKGLAEAGLVIVDVDDSSPYVVGKVMQFPERGGITPDAFLEYVKQPDGKPLFAEMHFVTRFECLRNGGPACL